MNEIFLDKYIFSKKTVIENNVRSFMRIDTRYIKIQTSHLANIFQVDKVFLNFH